MALRALLLLPLACLFSVSPTVADMDRYLWSHRPLIVIVPARDHPLIAAQKAALTDTRGFAERDMVLIVVEGEDRVSVDGNPAPADLVPADLRHRYRVLPSAAQVLLVGKDGGVKRRAARPLPEADLFRQIDAMPMRLREMQQQGND